ncbi:hypothetical protein Hbl1158_04495 [Halobaculum sp. CBA1158]|uniref:glycosyltransferase n=1 Tax=Halobaculum sp. CBA1158 TaxID=2904243 RepID=UPI001F313E79|nr:hypothetical protein [Halobaculum sp. CBA1158]UIP00626.1 hypothetical protein Hbl1158_04495 [Halobaculum sp. CBA1158]
MAPTVAVAHYPEGAGHATRMLAIAEAIEDAGGTVRMAGGGAGTEFVALNGYDEFEPTVVDYIGDYQDGSVWRTATRSLPASVDRIADYRAWLSATEPDALVTDDMFAAIAATRCDVPLYVLKHDMPGLYDDLLERTGAGVHTRFQLSAAREFFYPVVWPESGADPPRATRIPPVALDGEPPVRDGYDVVVVPSHYSSLSRIADHLRRQGYDVLDVSDESWEPVESLLPYLRGADAVVCSGYSTVMDAAVAGTPCVVHPATDEQDAVAEWLERFDVTGFAVAPDPIDVLDAVAAPPDPPAFENGAEFIARRVTTDLCDPDPYAAEEVDGAEEIDGTGAVDGTEVQATDPEAAAGMARANAPVATGSRLASFAAVPALAAACLVTTGSLLSPSRAGRSVAGTVARGVGGLRTAGGHLRRAGGRVAGAVAGAVTDALSAGRDGCGDAVGRVRRVVPDRSPF